KQRGRHGETKRLSGPEVDDQFEFGRLEDWNIARLGAFQDLVSHIGDAAAGLSIVDPIGHEPAGSDALPMLAIGGSPIWSPAATPAATIEPAWPTALARRLLRPR